MTKYRIVKKPKYTHLWFVQKLGLLGWHDVYWAEEDICNIYLDNIIKYGISEKVLREEEVKRMTKYRIIKKRPYTLLRFVQRKTLLFGWETIFSGPLPKCNEFLDDLKYNNEIEVLREETI